MIFMSGAEYSESIILPGVIHVHTVMNVGKRTGDRCETFKDRAQTRTEFVKKRRSWTGNNAF